MTDHILSEYDGAFHLNSAFAGKMQSLIKDLLENKGLRVHNVTSRVKDKQSLEKKLLKKNKYKALSQITDIIGVRVITFFEDEVDTVAKIISDEFEVDKENSIDKRVVEYDKFGYSSLHYVVSLKKERLALTEYSSFKEIQVEVQIRSILQHAWAEIEHDIGYKSKDVIPDVIKRNFSRVAALLETSDFEFTKLRDKLLQYEENVENDISENPESVELNSVSLQSFARSNNIIDELDNRITGAIGSIFDPSAEIDTSDIPKFTYLGVKNIQQLSDLLIEKKDKIVDYAVKLNDEFGHNHEGAWTVKGISLFYLCYLLIAERNSKEEVERFVAEFWNIERFPELPQQIINAYTRLNM